MGGEPLLGSVQHPLGDRREHVLAVVQRHSAISYTFDYSNQTLIGPKGEKRLTKKEAEVLRLLCINMNKILRREIALKMICGEDDYFMGRSMDVYITKLRKFLSDDPKVSITNIHRTGFMLEVNQ